MEQLKLSTQIDAPVATVWQVLWNDVSYREWTSVFSPGSHAVTDDWKEGSKVLFLDPNGMGMVSMVHKKIPNEYMSFQHLGEVKNGVEDTNSEKVKAWAGAMENYILEELDGGTRLTIEMDIGKEFKDMFEKIWPQALGKIKELAEKNH